METTTSSLPQNEFEVKTEEQVEKLVGDIGRAIRNAEPGRRAGLKELAETLLHEEIASIREEPEAAETTTVRKRANPLAAGILLAARIRPCFDCSVHRSHARCNRRDPGTLGWRDQLVAFVVQLCFTPRARLRTSPPLALQAILSRQRPAIDFPLR